VIKIFSLPYLFLRSLPPLKYLRNYFPHFFYLITRDKSSASVDLETTRWVTVFNFKTKCIFSENCFVGKYALISTQNHIFIKVYPEQHLKSFISNFNATIPYGLTDILYQ